MTELVCSARGCREEAAWGLRWNNPRIHTADRRKVWLACPDHREHLEGFLAARGLWKDTVALDELLGDDGAPGGDGAP